MFGFYPFTQFNSFLFLCDVNDLTKTH